MKITGKRRGDVFEFTLEQDGLQHFVCITNGIGGGSPDFEMLESLAWMFEKAAEDLAKRIAS